ncbi:MAG: FAD-dependent oxidoreductase [Elusimicrobiota bacterium]
MALIKKYKSIVSNIEQPFTDIYVVTFKSIEKPYRYLPGQFLHLTLDSYDPSCAWPDSRCFSMQTSQDDEVIKITYSVKGKYTKRMAQELAAGKQVWLKLPYGELFTKQHQKKDAVFIAGGTGVTPYLSLFTNTMFAEYINPKLYLGVREKRCFIYGVELEKAVGVNPGFSYDIIYQDTAGILSINKMFAEHGKAAMYFISGPPGMIKCFKAFLFDNGVSQESVRTDDWE